jgi:hypothetical protein
MFSSLLFLAAAASTSTSAFEPFYIPWCEPALDSSSEPVLQDPLGLYGTADCTQVLSPVDLRAVLDQPTPADGFIEVGTDGTFEVNGDPIRFFSTNFMDEVSRPKWGGNLTVDAAADTANPVDRFTSLGGDHADVDDHIHAVLERLAVSGVNMIRIHHMDDAEFLPGCADSTDPSCDWDEPNPELLESLTRFIDAAGDAGIYVNLNLHSTRTFSSERFADVLDAANHDDFKTTKYLIYALSELADAQKATATHILSATMPGGHTLAEDPALGVIELTNENPLITKWYQAKIHGETDPAMDGHDYAGSQAVLRMDELWNEWLAIVYSSDKDLETAWGTAWVSGDTRATATRMSAGELGTLSQRYSDTLAFHEDLVTVTFQDMRQHLRDLGFDGPILNTTSHYSQPDQFAAQDGVNSSTDPQFFDSHVAWDPRVEIDGLYCYHEQSVTVLYDDTGSLETEEVYGDLKGPDGNPAAHPMASLALGAMADVPFMPTEYAYKSLGQHNAESLPLLAAFAGFQGWDGIGTLGFSDTSRYTARVFEDLEDGSPWDLMRNPALAINAPFSAIVARKGYGTSATVLRVDHSEEEIENRFHSDAIEDTWGQPYLSGATSLVSSMRRGELGGSAEAEEADYLAATNLLDSSDGTIQSTDGTMTWDIDKHQFVFAAPEAVAFIGFVDGEPVNAGRLTQINITNADYAVVSAVSLDEQELSQSGSILVTVASTIRHETESTNRQEYTTDGRTYGCYADPTPSGYFEAVMPEGSLVFQLDTTLTPSVAAVDALGREVAVAVTSLGMGLWQLPFNDTDYAFSTDGTLTKTPWFIITASEGTPILPQNDVHPWHPPVKFKRPPIQFYP